MIRESRDEEIVADILAVMIYCRRDKNNIPATSSTILDELYGLKVTNRTREFNSLIRTCDMNELCTQFIKTYDVLRKILTMGEVTFAELIFDNPLLCY